MKFFDGFYLHPERQVPEKRIERGFLVETDAPFRRGQGIIWRWRGRGYQLGWGRPGSNPMPPLDVPVDVIRTWTAPPPEQQPHGT